MIKNGVNKVSVQAKDIKKILITQPKPESEKSPYFELSRGLDSQVRTDNQKCFWSSTYSKCHF